MIPSVMPAMTTGLAPVRGSTRVCTVVEVTTIMTLIGRNATPGLQRREAERSAACSRSGTGTRRRRPSRPARSTRRRRRGPGPRRCAAAAADARPGARARRSAISSTRAERERDDRQRVRPGAASRRWRSRRRARTGRPTPTSDAGQVDPGPVALARALSSSRSATIAVGTAITRLTYRHQRHDSACVSAPPSSSPTDAPPPAIAPKMPNALARSGEPAKVTVSRPSAEGASSAPNAPCRARAATSIPNDCARPPIAEAHGEADQPGDEGPLAPEQVAELAAEQQQAAERQRVGGDRSTAGCRWRSAAPSAPTAARC